MPKIYLFQDDNATYIHIRLIEVDIRNKLERTATLNEILNIMSFKLEHDMRTLISYSVHVEVLILIVFSGRLFGHK